MASRDGTPGDRRRASRSVAGDPGHYIERAMKPEPVPDLDWDPSQARELG